MTGTRSPDSEADRGFELIEIASHQLTVLSEALLRLGVQLDIQAIPEDKWGPTVGTLRLMHGLNGRRLIAVAGGQGAGKTHLMRNLYPEAAGWLDGNLGRGEMTAVAIEERADCAEPRGIVVRRRRWDQHGQKMDTAPGKGLTYVVTYSPDRREEWRSAVLGEGSDVLLAVLEVPRGFLGADGWGFALLPGFERASDSHWQHLMKLILTTSPAALVVADGAGLADATHAALLTSLRAVGQSAIDFVVAMSRCEELGSKPEVLAQRALRAQEVYGASEADVIPVGRTRDDPPGWPDSVRAALGRIRATSAQGRHLEAVLLRHVIRNDVQAVVNLARHTLDSITTGDEAAAEVARAMDEFDRESDSLRASLRRKVRTAFRDHEAVAESRMKERLPGGWNEVPRRLRSWALMRPDESDDRLSMLVDEAWNAEEAQRIQRSVIEQVALERWRAAGQQFAESLADRSPGSAALALLAGRSGAVSDDGTVESGRGLAALPAVKALPGAALQARTVALGLAEPDGTISAAPTERKLDEIIKDITVGQRRLLTALDVLVNGAERPQGEDDLLGNLAEIVASQRKFRAVARNLLAGSGTTAAVVTAAAEPAIDALAAAGTGAVAGATAVVASASPAAAAAAGAGATGVAAGTSAAAGAGAAGATGGAVATASLAAVLTAAAVGAVTAAVIQAGNRAMRERNRLAAARLSQWRVATEESILADVEELLRVTRGIVLARLEDAFGVDEELTRRFALMEAIASVKRARAQMLETLGDAHLA
jgi:hypothetical protein